MRNQLTTLLLCALAGMVLLPATAYLAANRLIGPYGGARGIGTYFATVYGDATTGGLLALTLLLAPLLILGVWRLRRRALKTLQTRPNQTK